jgi:hypothetical protein
MVRRTRRTWRWQLNCVGTAGQRGGSGVQRWGRPHGGHRGPWHASAARRRREGGEVPTDVKHTACGVSSHRGGGRRRGWDENLTWNGGFRLPGIGFMSSSEGDVNLGLR